MFKVLIIGLGQVAMGYDFDADQGDVVLTHARAFATHEHFELIGGVDPLPGRCAQFAHRYGGHAGTDVVDVLERTRPDVVVIATPTPHHAEVLEIVLRHATPRLILCEKPLAEEIQTARRMVQACRDANCLLYVNYMRRVEPGAREVGGRIGDGRIETPVKGVAWYSKGLLHNGSHFSNLMEFWLGPVTGFKVIEPGRRWDGRDPEPDVQMTFTEGTVTFLSAREECFSHHEVHLIAPNGRLRYEQGGASISWQPALEDPVFKGYRVLSDSVEVIPSDSHRVPWHVADHISARLAGAASGLCSGEDALHTLEALFAIRAAL